ncbi:MAG: hypothetical protein N3B21_02050 [Clostridia bacterium]|nr:hypothetical protein [Clostridia bacterium]
MKKALTLTLVLLLTLTTSCKSTTEKINIIPGGGSANNSLMVSFNELCPGTVESFIEISDKLLITRKDGHKINFYKINPQTKEEKLVFSTITSDNPQIEISPDRKYFLYDNYLVDIEKAQRTILPEAPSLRKSMPRTFTDVPLYSFLGENEVIFSNPYFYLKNYYSIAQNTLDNFIPKIQLLSMTKLGGKNPSPVINNFKGIDVPDISYISKPKFLDHDLKYIFIGFNKNTDENSLYILDLFAKKFILIDSNIKDYALSPDCKSLAYIKKVNDDKPVNKLYLIDTEEENKEELAELPSISGLSWSYDSQWVAYSGGEQSKSDIWVTSRDKKVNEQLTYGMYTTSKLAWSQSGNKVAFTSSPASTSGKPSTYIVSLNIPASNTALPKHAPDQVKQPIVLQLIDIVRYETARMLQNQKN